MVTVRDATREDLPEIAAIYNALLDTTTHEWTEIPHTVSELGRMPEISEKFGRRLGLVLMQLLLDEPTT